MPNFKTYLFLFALVLMGRFGAAHEVPPCVLGHSLEKPFCDLCSCATNSGNSGFGTLSNTNFMGLRFLSQDFESRDGIFSNSPSSHESVETYQLWAQIPILKNVRATASLPYQDLRRTFENGSPAESLQGLGDASVVGWYTLRFSKKADNDSISYPFARPPSKHSLQFGMGAKLPTGAFEERLTDRVNPGFQVGTGSLDGIFSLGYNYSGDKIGLNALGTYYLKGENRNEYRFGDQFSYAGTAYYTLPMNTVALMPFLGISGDLYNSIEQFGERLKDTSGHIVNGTLGTELAFNRFIFGANLAIPLSQHLFGDNVKARNRLSIYLNFSL